MAEGEVVQLYVYDLSCGLAARLSPALIGKQVEGIWHTGVVVYGKEYFFGSHGISVATPGSVINEPTKKITLGTTHIPIEVFEDYLNGLAESEFRGSSYNLLNHNCNNFSDTISHFLVGSGIPDYIVNLPNEILNTPFGHTYRGLIEQISQNSPNLQSHQTFSAAPREPSPEYYQIHSEIEAARQQSLLLKEKRNKIHEKLAKRERKKNKRRRGSESKNKEEKMSEEVVAAPIEGNGESLDMADEERSSDTSARMAAAIDEEERKEREERRRNREPPIIFKDAVDVHIEFDSLVGLIDGKLNEEEQLSLEELGKYMIEDEGSWALGENFLVFVGRLLNDKDLGAEISVRILQVLAAAALKDDIILMLHQDRKHHILMNYAYDVDRHPLPQQKSLTLFICNLFENIGSSEWLMYISEWSYNNNQLSNIRVTTKVAVNALLSDDVDLQDRGSAIIYNLATKEVKTVVFDDIAVELTMAVLQFLAGDGRSESHVFRCLKALQQFCQVGQDIPQLVQMIGPHPSKFKGQSERNDQLIQEITKKLR